MRLNLLRTFVVIGATALAGAGCAADVDRSAALEQQGDPEVGRELMREVGCMACHRVPDSAGPEAFVGPPLDSWSRRSFIAGTLPNNEANLERWILDPRAVRPGSAMPTIELTDSEIDDIVAFLFSLD